MSIGSGYYWAAVNRAWGIADSFRERVRQRGGGHAESRQSRKIARSLEASKKQQRVRKQSKIRRSEEGNVRENREGG